MVQDKEIATDGHCKSFYFSDSAFKGWRLSDNLKLLSSNERSGKVSAFMVFRALSLERKGDLLESPW